MACPSLIAPFAAGVILIAVGVGVAATMHESAMALVIVLAGAAICLPS